MKLYEIFRLMEISDKVKTQMRDRFKQQDSNLTDQQIDYYLNKWDKFANSFPADKRDITRLSFDQVEQLIDAAEAKQAVKGRSRPQNQPLEGAIYDRDNLMIYKGDAKPKCIQYGQGYSWCISRADSSNLYTRYRFFGSEPVFYFVFDKDRSKDDPLHAVVIHVDNKNNYRITTSRNDGDRNVSWQEITKQLPKLAPLQSLFKPQPVSDEERSDYQKYGKRMPDEVVNQYTYAEKAKYIEFGNKVSHQQQDQLPYELLAAYAKQNPYTLSSKSMNRLKMGDFKYVVSLLIQMKTGINEFENLDKEKQDYLEVGVVKDNSELATDPTKALGYAMNVLGGEFPGGEDTIAKDSETSWKYARNVIKRRFPKGEAAIATDSKLSWFYAYELLNGERFPEGEAAIAAVPNRAYIYAYNIIKGPFPEGEAAIATSAEFAVQYAVHVLEGRFPAGEPAIAKEPIYAHEYAKFLNLKYNEKTETFSEKPNSASGRSK
jgi:hypothetical protein